MVIGGQYWLPTFQESACPLSFIAAYFAPDGLDFFLVKIILALVNIRGQSVPLNLLQLTLEVHHGSREMGPLARVGRNV